jgi:chromate reductase
MIQLLAVCGSLRVPSSNRVLLQAAERVLGARARVAWFDGIADLPAFNPDCDAEPYPPAVLRWRGALDASGGVLLSSPEYAHGVPGALKNALDWVVGSNELYEKPIALLNPSPESRFAHPQLVEILRTMNAFVIDDASRTIAIPRRGADVDSVLADPAVRSALEQAMTAFIG